jgi:serine/threonine protein kinase/DNA-binding NarL/FixJ family response regulator
VDGNRKSTVAKRLSREEFLRNLADSGLFSQEEIDTTLDAMPAPLAADGEALAEHLIATDKLTPFQAAAVRERRLEELVIGNYQVLDRLGAGGMGTVYKARHRRMKRVVAIKVLRRSAGQPESFLQRFQREVEAVARLSHPNIVLAHDADEAEVGHFLVMEFVNGRDLTAEVEGRGPLPVAEAVDAAVQAARALDYAHGQGIIHRDIKPANLLRSANGVIKVTDLGLARFNDQLEQSTKAGTALTQAGTIMGTVDFMSPEQALGLTTIDHRADIYSLGCTLYYLLIGRPPFQGTTVMAVLLAHRDGPIPSLCAARGEIPAALNQVFQRMMAKKPEDRFASMAEVVRALEGLTLPAEPQSRQPAEPVARQPAVLSPTVAARPVTMDAAKALPSMAGQAQQTIDLPPASEPGTSAMMVLLVEPSRTQSGIIRRYLQAQGIRHVVGVASGQEALQAMRRQRPDAVLSALHLSDMTGVQLAQRIHAEYKPAAPGFVLVSSEAESGEAGSLSKCGKAVLLHKPFTPEALREALRLVTAAQAPAADRGKLRVLIVDDSTPARLYVRSVLQGLGLAHFVEAADGAQAVAAVARQGFDLIVTDYNMPLMDGRGLVGYLKQNPATAPVPILMVTTETDPAKLEEVRRLGVAAVCDKSFPPEVAEKIIDQLV